MSMNPPDNLSLNRNLTRVTPIPNQEPLQYCVVLPEEASVGSNLTEFYSAEPQIDCCLINSHYSRSIFKGFYFWSTIMCRSDARTSSNAAPAVLFFGICCPVACFLWYGTGTFIISNYLIAIANTHYFPVVNYPSYCFFFDVRKFAWYRHYLLCGLCGRFGPNSYSENAGTGLHGAAIGGYVNFAELQVRYGDDIDGRLRGTDAMTTGMELSTPLILACRFKTQQQRGMIRFLVHSGADLNLKDAAGHTALYYACKEHLDIETVKFLVEHGANLHDDDSEHPLDLIEETPVKQQLLELQGKSIKGIRSLLKAVEFGRLREIKHCMSLYPDLNANSQTLQGTTLLEVAVSRCKKEVSLYLLLELASGGVSMHPFQDPSKVAILMRWLIEEGECSGVKFLLGLGYVDLVRNEGNTPLHIAAAKSKFDVIMALIESGAFDLRAENSEKVRPFGMFPDEVSKELFYRIDFPHKVLVAKENEFWFHLVQLENVSEKVFGYTRV